MSTGEVGRFGVIRVHALVDKVPFGSREDDGTIVHLEEALAYAGASPPWVA